MKGSVLIREAATAQALGFDGWDYLNMPHFSIEARLKRLLLEATIKVRRDLDRELAVQVVNALAESLKA